MKLQGMRLLGAVATTMLLLLLPPSVVNAAASDDAGVVRAAPLQEQQQVPPNAPEPRLNVIVVMKEPRPAHLTDARAIRRRLRQKHKACDGEQQQRAPPDHVDAMVEGLKQHATETHAPVLKLVHEEIAAQQQEVGGTGPNPAPVAQSIWITNEVSVRQATPALVERLRELPSVRAVRPEWTTTLPPSPVPTAATATATIASTVDTSAPAERPTPEGPTSIPSPPTGPSSSPPPLFSSTSSSNSSTPTTPAPSPSAPSTASNASTSASASWGQVTIGAPGVWARGHTGRGIRIGVIDSGARATHGALVGRQEPLVGWFDALGHSPRDPVDPHGHGTGVLSLATGGWGLGVAPEATWLACRACDAQGNCDELDVLRCAQFLLCPAVPGPGSRDCTRRPHVVNLSWSLGTGANDDDQGPLAPVLAAWLAAGMVPVLAAGNDGPQCASVVSPAAWAPLPALTVGATTPGDDLSRSSARGPGPRGELRPALTAPGERLLAAGPTDDEAIVEAFEGTSAATPLVAGAAALLLEARPGLAVADVHALLTRSAERVKLVPRIDEAAKCQQGPGPSPPGTNTTATWAPSPPGAMGFPNNLYGHGRLDVERALALALETTAAH